MTSMGFDPLVDLSRLLADAAEPRDVLVRLAEFARSLVPVAEVHLVVIDGGRWVCGDDAFDELDDAVVALEARGGPAQLFPLVSRGGLFGALVLRSPDDAELPTELFEAMTNLAAVALDNAQREADLRRTLAELRASREQLVRDERLRVLGELAAIVSHEVRNPLAAAGGALQILHRRLAHAPEEQRIIQSIRERLGALDQMLTDVLAYARPRPPVLAPLELLQLARDVVEEIREDPANVRVSFEAVGEPAQVRADRAQVYGVVLNLAVNAVQACRGVGNIEISVTRGRDLAELVVRDDGPGVPDDIRPRIFDAFFTARPGGTGLGLAIARGVAEAHGGHLDLLPPSSRGAAFRLRLPYGGQALPRVDP